MRTRGHGSSNEAVKHGQNANFSGCPHCGADNTPWIGVLHPNAVGHAHTANKWIAELGGMLAMKCN